VRDESPIGIMADESLFSPTDALKLIQVGACDYFNIKLMKAGYFSHTFDPIVDGMAVRNGMITLPEKPGLGVDVDPAFLKKLKRA